MTSPEVRERLDRALDARYRIDRELGRGGMATVFLAHDSKHDRQVALKVMHPEIAFALGRERFLREIRFAARLSHPHIVSIYDSGEADGLLFYVMPFVEGESLRDRLDRESQLPIDESLRLTREIADGLAYAHSSGIVHRDIKPENILISHNHASIADFGIAWAVGAARDDRITATGISLGTPAYMSPEQALGEQVDASTDAWALGCVLYEMIAGFPPFGSEPRQVLTRSLTTTPAPLSQVRQVPDGVQTVIDSALARGREERIANGQEFGEALDNASSGLSVQLKHNKQRRRTPRIAAIATGVAALLIIVGALAWRAKSASNVTVSNHASRGNLSSDSLAVQYYTRGRAQFARRTQAGVADAFALFNKAIERDSSFALAWAGLARTTQWVASRGLSLTGVSVDSMISITLLASERALVLDSGNAEIWLVRANAAQLLDPQDRRTVLAAERQALALDSTYADAWFQLALTEQELLRDNASEQHFLRSIRLSPRNVQTLAFLALHYLWTRQYKEGLKWADSAVAVDPTYVLAREALGQLSLAAGQFDAAEREHKVYLRMTKGREQVNSLAELALVEAAQGNLSSARSYAIRAAALADSTNPTKHEAPYIGAAFAAIGDTARAIKWIAAFHPREDLHFQLHLKRDPPLNWLHGPLGRGLLTADPK
jgi:serine/threonine protein kinase